MEKMENNILLNNAIKIMENCARENYNFYLEYVHKGLYKPARHTDYICEKLEMVERGIIKKLMVFLPPRHSKSMSISETFPSYFIGKNPERRVIEVSYSDSLAKKFGRSNRNKVREYGEQLFNIRISEDNAGVTNWGIDGHRGGMISAGIMGSITGEGSDLLVIDDPIKNRAEADSATYRNRLWDEWQNTLLTRLSPDGRTIIVLTRWHENDLAGKILKEEGKEWEIISLPAIAEKNDLLGRTEGEPLWPEYGFNKKWAEKRKIAVGSRTWNALYQQRPAPSEGNIFKREHFNIYDILPKLDEMILSCDCTFKDLDTSDFVVVEAWGRKGANKYLVDQIRGRFDIIKTMDAINTLAKKYPNARAKLIEDKANGSAVISMLKNKLSGIIPVNPDASKVARANAVVPDFEAGNIYVPNPSFYPWVGDYIEEMVTFPVSTNDDMVDSTTQAISYLNKSISRLVKYDDNTINELSGNSTWDI